MRISDWSSDVCSSDLRLSRKRARRPGARLHAAGRCRGRVHRRTGGRGVGAGSFRAVERGGGGGEAQRRSEEHTSELQSLMRISYAVFCLKKKNTNKKNKHNTKQHTAQKTSNKI